MKRTITISIVLSVLMVLSASIMAVSASAGSVSASGAAAMPSPTPKKGKKPAAPPVAGNGSASAGTGTTSQTGGSQGSTPPPAGGVCDAKVTFGTPISYILKINIENTGTMEWLTRKFKYSVSVLSRPDMTPNQLKKLIAPRMENATKISPGQTWNVVDSLWLAGPGGTWVLKIQPLRLSGNSWVACGKFETVEVEHN